MLALLPALWAGGEGFLVSTAWAGDTETVNVADPSIQPGVAEQIAPEFVTPDNPDFVGEGESTQAAKASEDSKNAATDAIGAVAEAAAANTVSAAVTSMTDSGEVEAKLLVMEERDFGPTPEAPDGDWSHLRNPTPADPKSLLRGRTLYLTKGLCNVCHGDKGDGFGPVRGQFIPYPNDFFSPEWGNRFTDGELMGVLVEGKVATGMVPLVPEFITAQEGWDVINFLRTLRGGTSEDYENFQSERKIMENKFAN